MWRPEFDVIQLRVWWRGGSLLQEATAKYYKQWSTKLDLSESAAVGEVPGLRVLRW